MSAWTPPFAYGEKAPIQAAASFSSQAPAPNYDKLLGWKYTINGNDYKVVKTGAAFTTGQVQALVMLDAGTTAKTNIVSASAGAAAIKSTIAGIASPAQVALNSGDYFLVQTAGRATVTSAAAGITVNTAQITGAAGTATDAGAITTAIWSQIIGISHQARTSGQQGEIEMEYIA
jgi:hypothetical protein